MKKKLSLLLISIFLSSAVCSAQKIATWNDIPEDVKNTNVFKRFAWEYQQRAYPYDTVPGTLYHQERSKEIQRINNSRLKNMDQLSWTSLGPKGVDDSTILPNWGVCSGRVRALAIHPADPLTVYIGAAGGGIWKTIDGGENWLDIGHDLESLSFGAIAIDPANPETIYAGTGEAVFLAGFIHFSGVGLYKSMDGGANWQLITNGFGSQTHFSDLEVSPHNSNIVIATMASGCFYLGTGLSNEGVWKSTDGGNNWDKILDVIDAYDILFHPTDPNIVYSAVGGVNDNAGFYISTDEGNTWNQSNNGLQSPNTISRMHIDIAQSDPDILYAVTHEPSSGNPFYGTTRAYKSEYGGISWNPISEGVPLGGNYGSGWADQGFYDLCIAVNPLNPNHVLIGNIELHETTNGADFLPKRPYGNNASGSLVHTDYHILKFSLSNPDYLYIGCDGGIYKSIDAGASAISINDGLETLQFYRIGSHPTNPNNLLGGMQDNGTARTIDGGNSWDRVVRRDGMECFFDYNDPNVVYASAQNCRLFKSLDGGSNFNQIYLANGAWITPFIMHPENSNWLYTANKRILFSTTGTLFYPLFTEQEPTAISTLSESHVNPEHMIFATGGGSIPMHDSIIIVKVSTDGGYNWEDVTNNIPGEERWITRVVTDPVEENTLYIVRTGFSAGNKVYKSTDLGQTWTNISGDLPDLPCNDLFIDPENTDHLYLANDLGVYQSTNGGTNWNYASEEMPFVPVIDFDYADMPSGRYLRAGTHGRSIYETNLLYVGTDEFPSSKENVTTGIKIHNYPNPFSTSITIEYELQQAANVEITIFNQTGQQIEMITRWYDQKGKYQYVWDERNLPKGIYFVRVRAGQEMATGKVIKIR